MNKDTILGLKMAAEIIYNNHYLNSVDLLHLIQQRIKTLEWESTPIPKEKQA